MQPVCIDVMPLGLCEDERNWWHGQSGVTSD